MVQIHDFVETNTTGPLLYRKTRVSITSGRDGTGEGTNTSNILRAYNSEFDSDPTHIMGEVRRRVGEWALYFPWHEITLELF